MNNFIIISILFIFSTITKAQNYIPFTSKESIKVDTFFDKFKVEEKYRWLEDVHSDETKEWIEQQNKLSKKYLSKTSFKTNSFASIDRYSFVKHEFRIKKGKYYFNFAYPDNHTPPALYYRSAFKSKPKLLISPNYISKKDKIIIKNYWVSKDSELLAYQFSRNGSDWVEVKVVSLKTGKHKKDHLEGLKFSNIAWREDGFFYSTYNQQDQFGQTIGQKLFYHKIGTDQTEDKLIFERKNKPFARFRFMTTSNEQFFVLKEINEQENKTNFYYIDYNLNSSVLKPLITTTGGNVNILDSREGKFIALSFIDSSNGMIVEINPENPYKWRAVVPEYKETLLLKAIPFSDRIVIVYQSNRRSFISIFDYSGSHLHNVEFPVARSVARSVGRFSGNSTDEELFYYYTSYTIPPIVYKLNIKTFKNEPSQTTFVNFDFKDIVYEEIEYLSKDSTVVPMVLVYEKGIKLNGSNPTVLKAYGGFGRVTPLSFDPGIVHFIKEGGVFAFANIRGGGDKGKEWAKDGKGRNKQNSFDDFIAAAEFLIEKKYTNKNKLAITGASNGGLVVAVAATQRPDLFRAVVPIVAPFDMLRFEKFTVGHMHVDEYGTVKDSSSFTKLKNYSPYHNVQEKLNYPAMLIVTSENDDRVPPFHSYKFVARMQSRSAQKNPILLKVEKRSGHSGASSRISRNKSMADVYGFIMSEVMN